MFLDDLPEIMTREDIAEALYIGRDKSYRILNNGCMKVLKFGAVIRVRREDFIEFLNNDSQKGLMEHGTQID